MTEHKLKLGSRQVVDERQMDDAAPEVIYAMLKGLVRSGVKPDWRTLRIRVEDFTLKAGELDILLTIEADEDLR